MISQIKNKNKGNAITQNYCTSWPALFNKWPNKAEKIKSIIQL